MKDAARAKSTQAVNQASARGLGTLVLAGPTLHASLNASQLDLLRDLPTKTVPPSNPHLSTEADFVESMGRGSSQGRIDGQGIRAGLYARYTTGKNEIGYYGLETKSDAHATWREKAMRRIWAINASRDRARVHRKGRILVLVWSSGVPPECWESVNVQVAKRLETLSTP